MKKWAMVLVVVLGIALGIGWYVKAKEFDTGLPTKQPGDLFTSEEFNFIRDQIDRYNSFFAKIDAIRRIFAFALLVPITEDAVVETNNITTDGLQGGFATLTRTDIGTIATVVAKGLDPLLDTEVQYYHFNDTSACEHPITLSHDIPFVDLDTSHQLQCDPLADDTSVDGVCFTNEPANPSFLCGSPALVTSNNLEEICEALGVIGTTSVLKTVLFLPIENECNLTNPLGEGHVVILQEGIPVWRAGFREFSPIALTFAATSPEEQ